MAVVADTAAAVANTARSFIFITVVRNADMCPPETRAGGLPCLVSRACCRVALIPPSAADTVRQIKQVVSMSPGALCQGRRQRSPSMLRPTGVQGQPMVGVDGAGAKWSQSRSMFGALSRPALVLLAARRRRPGVTKPWRTESRYTVNKFVADPPRPPPGIPDWPNSPTPARLGHPRCGQRPAPTRRPSTTWPATHTWLPSPEPTTPERRRSERRWPTPHPSPTGERRSASPNLSRSPGRAGILGEGCRDCYRPVRRRSQSSTVARVDASAVPRRRCSRRCAMDRRYSGMANDGRSRPPPATRMWWANPRSRVVIGTTMTSPTGQALNALVETTRTGRVPLCSPGPAGSRDASQPSPRSGIQTLDRCFLPLATLGEVVAPCLGVHLAQLAHLSGGLLHQCPSSTWQDS